MSSNLKSLSNQTATVSTALQVDAQMNRIRSSVENLEQITSALISRLEPITGTLNLIKDEEKAEGDCDMLVPLAGSLSLLVYRIKYIDFSLEKALTALQM